MSSNFLKRYAHDNLLNELNTAIKMQFESGNVTESEIKKFIELIKNTQKLKTALLWL